jgi:hypothetical protein
MRGNHDAIGHGSDRHMVLRPSFLATAPLGQAGRPAALGMSASGVVVALAGASAIGAFDASLAQTFAVKTKRHGQVALAGDGRRIAVSLEAEVRVFESDGKVACKHGEVAWWEENSGGVAFSQDGAHLLVTYLPDDEEPEAGAAIVLGAVDLTTGKRIATAVPEDFEEQAHHSLFALPDGRHLWWANAQQDAQRYGLVSLDGQELSIASHDAPSGSPFLRCITAAGDYLVQNGGAVEWYSAATGDLVQAREVSSAIGDDELYAAAPLDESRLLLFVLGSGGAPRLVVASGAKGEDVTIEGLDGAALAGMASSEGRTLLVDDHGAVIML